MPTKRTDPAALRSSWERAAAAAFSCLSPEVRDDPVFRRHAVWERLAVPARSGSFQTVWMDDGGQVRAVRGFFALPPGEGGAVSLLLRSGIDGDAVTALGFLARLQSALLGREAPAVCGLDADPAALRDGESMRLCRALGEALPGRGRVLLPGEVPPREWGYLAGSESTDAPLTAARAAGLGLCFLVREALRLLRDQRPEGRTVVLRGRGPLADTAAEGAARLGMRVLPWGSGAELVLLCDPASPLGTAEAEALRERGARAVFEGVPLGCAPEAGARLAEQGVLFAPFLAAGAGWVLDGGGDDWERARLLRRQMRALLERVLAAGDGDLCRGTYVAALTAAAERLVRRGV